MNGKLFLGNHLVPANLLLANAEQQLIFTPLREYRLKNVLEPLFNEYDYILLDCPPSLGMLSLIALVASRYVLVPIQTQFKATVGTDSLLSTVHKTKKQNRQEAQLIALTENLQREDLNPVEETEGILALLSIKLEKETTEVISYLNRLDHAQRGNLKTETSENESAHNVMGRKEIEEIFQALGLTWQSFLKNRLPLLKLPGDVLEKLREGLQKSPSD